MVRKKTTILVCCCLFLLIAIAAGAWIVRRSLTPLNETKVSEESKIAAIKRKNFNSHALESADKPVKNIQSGAKDIDPNTCSLTLGGTTGKVFFDEEKSLYFLEVRGARFPFQASPVKAQEVPLEASGRNAIEKNTSLLYGIMGKKVKYATVLINPDEEDDVMPAANDIVRYIRIANRRKCAGVAYTKAGGKLKRSVVRGSQIQTLDEATTGTPLILLKGPKSGASRTAVWVHDEGQVIVEGKTYEDLYEAADLICVTLLKMLCGSSDCPDAAACASGGTCGCG